MRMAEVEVHVDGQGLTPASDVREGRGGAAAVGENISRMPAATSCVPRSEVRIKAAVRDASRGGDAADGCGRHAPRAEGLRGRLEEAQAGLLLLSGVVSGIAPSACAIP